MLNKLGGKSKILGCCGVLIAAIVFGQQSNDPKQNPDLQRLLSAGSKPAATPAKQALPKPTISPTTVPGALALLDQAIVNKDLETIKKSLTADYTAQEEGGDKRNRDMVVNQFRGMFAVARRVIECKTNILSLKPGQGGMIALTKTFLAVELVNYDGGSARVEFTSEDTELWIKQGGRWLQKSSVARNMRTMINGRPAEPIE